jgi:hypothetical protein
VSPAWWLTLEAVDGVAGGIASLARFSEFEKGKASAASIFVCRHLQVKRRQLAEDL